MVPLSINCWPSVSGGESYVNIEYESSAPFDLQNVTITIPLPAQAQTPQVNQVGGCVCARPPPDARRDRVTHCEGRAWYLAEGSPIW